MPLPSKSRPTAPRRWRLSRSPPRSAAPVPGEGAKKASGDHDPRRKTLHAVEQRFAELVRKKTTEAPSAVIRYVKPVANNACTTGGNLIQNSTLFFLRKISSLQSIRIFCGMCSLFASRNILRIFSCFVLAYILSKRKTAPVALRMRFHYSTIIALMFINSGNL